jgi:hypothetical protein
MGGWKMNVLTEVVPHYYPTPQLSELIADVIAATTAIDLAFERQARAVEALTAYQADSEAA